MSGIQGTNTAGQQCKKLLDSVVTIMKYNKSTIDHVIHIKVLSDGTVYYLTVNTYDVLNTNNNYETAFSEIRKVFEEEYDIKF